MRPTPGRMQILAIRAPLNHLGHRHPVPDVFVAKSENGNVTLVEREVPSSTPDQALGGLAVRKLTEVGYKVSDGPGTEVFRSNIYPSNLLAIVRNVSRPVGGPKHLQEISLHQALKSIIRPEGNSAVYVEIRRALKLVGDVKKYPYPPDFIGKQALVAWLVDHNREREADITEAFGRWLVRVFPGTIEDEGTAR